MPASGDVHSTLDALWRLESGRIIGALTRRLRDLALAEEIAQDAVLTALEVWGKQGIPENPAGWLMTTAKNRAIDQLRRQQRYSELQQQWGEVQDTQVPASAPEQAAEADIDDDVLRLMFTVCHPLLSTEARVALSLRLVNGLSVAEIGRAYLVPETTLAQRITRAKRTLKAARIPFELPRPEERQARLASVLEAIYLIYNEGYTASSGDQWIRPALCEEALRLARSLAALAPEDTETLGLAALLELQTSRLAARSNRDGDAVLLEHQDRSQWDSLLIRRGLHYLEQAFALQQPLGPYCLQAAIAACHARARRWEETDWEDIVALYDGLWQAMPTAVVALNRAVAVARVDGPEAALLLLQPIELEGSLSQYHLFYSVRADLQQQCGQAALAQRDFLQAASLTDNRREQQLLQRRAADCLQTPAGRCN